MPEWMGDVVMAFPQGSPFGTGQTVNTFIQKVLKGATVSDITNTEDTLTVVVTDEHKTDSASIALKATFIL